MAKAQKELFRRAMIRGILESKDIAMLNTDLSRLSVLLLNEDSVQGLKPFNFLKNIDKLNDETGITKSWFDYLTRTIRSESVDIMAGKRIKRGVESLATVFDPYLPEAIRGTETLAVLFRVLFVPMIAWDKYPMVVRMTASLAKSLLLTMMLTDMLLSDFEVMGKPADYWIEELLVGVGTRIGGVYAEMHELAENFEDFAIEGGDTDD